MLCLLLTVSSVISPEVFRILSAELPHLHWWQHITSPFMHGHIDSRMTTIIHLALNMVLLLTVGKWTEQLIGTPRMLALTLCAYATFILVQFSSGIWINGSSGIIWAYSPFLLYHVKNNTARKDQARIFLIVMWGVVTVAMGFVPLIFNPSHKLIDTFVIGNLFHFTATITGFVGYKLFKL